ncbi:hypothetical protein B5F10_11535 [Anaerotruncus colihominis]|uniref:Uncharacterized protein n=1 Tax=Anaerotruncus colihominis TaxID=169435 RepID=A0A1Y4MM82_9FIRM|nr:hypothetical protein B5F11_07560 [Anaerotruncus colihominis]OUP73292.1 hypothetical protein B5F10_11535 [Anaerotruncus colihominis]
MSRRPPERPAACGPGRAARAAGLFSKMQEIPFIMYHSFAGLVKRGGLIPPCRKKFLKIGAKVAFLRKFWPVRGYG